MRAELEKTQWPSSQHPLLGSQIPKDALDTMTFDSGSPSEACETSDALRVGLVDSFAFTRGCLMEAFAALSRDIAVQPFETLADLVGCGTRNFDVVIFYHHDEKLSNETNADNDLASQRELVDIPVIVLSDAEDALEPKTVKAALKRGLRGFIPTRISQVKMVLAAIHFVRAGGVFIPAELLLSEEPTYPDAANEDAAPAGLLTERQMAVLKLLRQGKANKIIAYELHMSESTVKVHIRNIMRKIGATNRTQAIYKLQNYAA